MYDIKCDVMYVTSLDRVALHICWKWTCFV